MSELLRPIDQLLLFDDLERREPCCASDRTLLVRIMSERRVRRAIEAAGGQDRRQRHDPPAKALADDEDVGRRLELFAGVQRPGAREATRDLVEYQERAMALARVLDLRPEFRRRRLDGRPAQRLGDQRRDVPLNLERVVDIVGEALERLIVAEKAAREIERRQVLGAGSHGAKIATE